MCTVHVLVWSLKPGPHVRHGPLVWLCPPLPKPAGWRRTTARRSEPTGAFCFCAVQPYATEGSSGVILLCPVSTAFFAYLTHTHTLTHTHWALEHTHRQVNTHYTVVVWSDKGLVTGGQGVIEGVWPSAEATALNLPLSFLCNKCDRLISAQKEQLQGVV